MGDACIYVTCLVIVLAGAVVRGSKYHPGAQQGASQVDGVTPKDSSGTFAKELEYFDQSVVVGWFACHHQNSSEAPHRHTCCQRTSVLCSRAPLRPRERCSVPTSTCYRLHRMRQRQFQMLACMAIYHIRRQTLWEEQINGICCVYRSEDGGGFHPQRTSSRG